jgi:hypothetical protein
MATAQFSLTDKLLQASECNRIVTQRRMNDQAWYHVSFSHNKYLPDYHHVTWMRDSFFLANEKVIQVFPPKDQHYNFHPNCLHLWACLEGDVLPDFRTMGLV